MRNRTKRAQIASSSSSSSSDDDDDNVDNDSLSNGNDNQGSAMVSSKNHKKDRGNATSSSKMNHDKRTMDRSPNMSNDSSSESERNDISSNSSESENYDDDDASSDDSNNGGKGPGDPSFVDQDDEKSDSDDDQVVNSSSSSSQSSSNKKNNDQNHLPLQDRIRLREEQGLSLQKGRERKSKALQVASERLSLKRKKSSHSSDYDHAKKKKKNDSENGVGTKRKSKHAPQEVSSKRSDFFRRGAPRLNESGVGVEIKSGYKPIDPRTSSLSGHLNEEQFENNYSFLEEMRQAEIDQLKKQIAARKTTGKKGKRLRHKMNIVGGSGSLEEDEQKLKRLLQDKAAFERHKLNRAAKQAVKRKIRQDVETGKRGVYFLKRKEKKQLELEARLEEIRKRGGDKAVEKVLAKRRRKAKSRDAGNFSK